MTVSHKNKLGEGADSDVYLLKDGSAVVKYYDKLLYKIKKHDVDKCFNTLKLYSVHTIQAAELLESNWAFAPKDLRKITINNCFYEINFIMLPQGETYLMNESVVSVGQKYFSEPHLLDIFSNNSIDSTYSMLSKKEEELTDILLHANELINSNLKKNFTLMPINVKPILDKSTKKLDLIVTDLAASIYSTYFIL